MKMLRKASLVAVLLLCTVGVSLVVYGYIWAISNVVTVDVQYAVALETASVVDSSITLKATVTNNGLPARAGIGVDFYCSVDGGDWVSFATQFTDAAGVAQVIYTALYNGGYSFKAIVTIP